MLLSKKDVASLLQVNVSTVNNWMRDGKIPFLKFGASVRFEYEAVMEWGKKRAKK